MVFRPKKWSSHKVEKNRHFAKGLVHCFCPKINLFFSFFFCKKDQKETLFDILDKKERFLDLKIEVVAKCKKHGHFAKGLVYGFCQKIDLFLICFFFLSKKSQKETFFDILDKNECFLDHKRKVLKNSRKSTFCKGVSPLFLSQNGPFSHMFFF